MLRSIIALLLFFSAQITSVARAEEPLAEGATEKVDRRFSVPPQSPAQGIDGPFVWRTTFQYPTSAFLRVHFADIKDQSTDEFEVAVLDRNRRTIRTYHRSDFAREAFWSPVVKGDVINVEVNSKNIPAGLSFSIDEVAIQERHAAKFSLVHNPPELEEIIRYKNEAQIFGPSRSVAKLVFSANGKTYTCSGFLVSEDRFITNQHCIDRKEACVGNAVAIFGYELTDAGLAEGEQFDCMELLDSDVALDFALVRLGSRPGQKYGWLELTNRAVAQNEQTYLIQHPNGEPKQIARKQCYVSTLDAEGIRPGTDLGHQCDTVGGASGSPLLGKDFKVIGLHHLGFASVGRWKNENRAVQIGKVMERITPK